MTASRIDQLHALLAEEPGDRFLRYAIALEKKRAGDMEAAATDLEVLLKEDPKYIACYYQLALVLVDMGRSTEAIEACSNGALQSLLTGDTKARNELLALRNELAGAEDEA